MTIDIDVDKIEQTKSKTWYAKARLPRLWTKRVLSILPASNESAIEVSQDELLDSDSFDTPYADVASPLDRLLYPITDETDHTMPDKRSLSKTLDRLLQQREPSKALPAQKSNQSNQSNQSNRPPAIVDNTRVEQSGSKVTVHSKIAPPAARIDRIKRVKMNVHEHPLMRLAEAMNEITTDVQSFEEINPQKIIVLMDIFESTLPHLEPGKIKINVEHALNYVTDMAELIAQSDGVTDENWVLLYTAWYYAIMHLKRTGDEFDQYFVNLMSPDEHFVLEDDLSSYEALDPDMGANSNDLWPEEDDGFGDDQFDESSYMDEDLDYDGHDEQFDEYD